MLKLTKKTEYAFMAAKYMALKNSSGNSTAREISENYQIPFQLVAKVLQSLAKSEIVISTKGMNGGFSLTRKPDEITLIDIIKAVEKNYQITDCMKENGSSLDCSHFDCCKIRDPLIEIQKKIDKVFVETSLKQIL